MPAASAPGDHGAPGLGLALTVAIGLAVEWLGLGLAYFTTTRRGSLVTSLRRSVCTCCARARPASAREGLMLSQEFIRNALLAGTFMALACGVIGWFVVLRGQVFAGDALSHVAFPAPWPPPRPGGICVSGCSWRRWRWRWRWQRWAAAPGTPAGLRPPMTRRSAWCSRWCSGLGVLFLYLYSSGRRRRRGDGRAHAVRLDLRSGCGRGRVAAGVGARAVLVVMLAIARPLLLASLDPQVAACAVCRCACSGLAFLMAARRDVAEAHRRWVRCCCWACLPRRPAPRNG